MTDFLNNYDNIEKETKLYKTIAQVKTLIIFNYNLIVNEFKRLECNVCI